MSTTETTTPLTTGTWTVDPTHSSVGFQVKHMGLATVKGFFSDFEGKLEVGEDGTITASGTVETASVNTRNAQRDEHLRSPDFFDAERNPQISFRSTAIEPVDAETYRIAGELTIAGTTKEIELEAELGGSDVDPWGNTRAVDPRLHDAERNGTHHQRHQAEPRQPDDRIGPLGQAKLQQLPGVQPTEPFVGPVHEHRRRDLRSGDLRSIGEGPIPGRAGVQFGK